MSDETPESAGFEEPTEEESVPEPEAEPEGAAEAAEADDLMDPGDEEAATVVVSGVRRQTAPAPVRKKDLAAVDTQEADAAIEALESGFSDDDNAKAEAIRDYVKANKAPVKKGTATRKRSDSAQEAADPYRAANPAEFTRQSVRELKQVVWPTWPELVSYFSAVLIFVLFFIAFIGALDLLFGWSLLQLLGGKS